MTQWVVVTGGTSGIGRAVVERFLKDGQPVAVLARRTERLKELTAAFGPDQLRVEAVDVRDREAIADAVAQLTADDGGIAALVNNAGLSLGLGALDEGDPDNWRTMIDTNIEGLLNCTHAVLPVMKRAGSGHIINLGSLAAEYAFFGGNVYGATKAFVHQLSANLRVDLQGTGVRVTCVAPGMVRSEFALVRFGGDQEKADRLYEGIQPLSSEDIADAVLWAHRTPAHVNVNYIELMSVDQPFGLALSRAAVSSQPAG
ncbi:SDR family NAD(P)-dependent oxidoreductase [Streptacidiphilus fuscans]|uniref:SDR family NAD(P)-dependent oxidoreductase n=1 Tax=Streptacidiphilus fuscans TaxID=2789292 RepID=A0A931FDF3_9ACTN|nr:SDR family NAD(P)-dependent oxidoreductase [Streptacidiphilus fuscans]MBF9070652.1 SDR family NAD(P)-dependent oxidoreductase [Streptacidiphilus fuscans]